MQPDMLDRISINPLICHGHACIRGTRVMVSIVLDCLAAGMTDADVLRGYPSLALEDIRAAAAYGAVLAREQVLPIQASGV